MTDKRWTEEQCRWVIERVAARADRLRWDFYDLLSFELAYWVPVPYFEPVNPYTLRPSVL